LDAKHQNQFREKHCKQVSGITRIKPFVVYTGDLQRTNSFTNMKTGAWLMSIYSFPSHGCNVTQKRSWNITMETGGCDVADVLNFTQSKGKAQGK
jgi:hypothetical protein